MTRQLKTIALLILPALIFWWVCSAVAGIEESFFLFCVILFGIYSYGYLVMGDEEFHGIKKIPPQLMGYGFSVAGIATIVRIVFDGTHGQGMPISSIVIAALWFAVVLFAVIRTPLLKQNT